MSKDLGKVFKFAFSVVKVSVAAIVFSFIGSALGGENVLSHWLQHFPGTLVLFWAIEQWFSVARGVRETKSWRSEEEGIKDKYRKLKREILFRALAVLIGSIFVTVVDYVLHLSGDPLWFGVLFSLILSFITLLYGLVSYSLAMRKFSANIDSAAPNCRFSSKNLNLVSLIEKSGILSLVITGFIAVLPLVVGLMMSPSYFSVWSTAKFLPEFWKDNIGFFVKVYLSFFLIYFIVLLAERKVAEKKQNAGVR